MLADCPIVLAAVALTLSRPTGAQEANHLKCYNVKEPLAKASYTATWTGSCRSQAAPAHEGALTVKVP